MKSNRFFVSETALKKSSKHSSQAHAEVFYRLEENQLLTDNDVRTIITHSILILAAQTGFEGIEWQAAVMLTYTVTKYLRRIWKIMNICDKRRLDGRTSAFACSFLQVLRILKIEDVKDIAEFYLRRVIQRRNSLYEACIKEQQRAELQGRKRRTYYEPAGEKDISSASSPKQKKFSDPD
ncbi:unnamed protein product [Enterobius vermicularis]|uniref:Cyclin N-terminal domain-containing protein n=1 Tax=Enterobius vermicularis TaxID=51028 RepID=A0A0N4VJL7_ENTVE|nr:unnamed protein product [Enterobius vermicularis]